MAMLRTENMLGEYTGVIMTVHNLKHGIPGLRTHKV